MTALGQAIPSAVPGFDRVAGQTYDYRAALDHMRAAGYPFDPDTGRGGWPKPVDYLLYDQGVVLYTAQLLQQDLARIGIRLALKTVSWPAFLAMRTQRNRPGMAFASWQMDYPDPSTFFEPLFASSALAGESTYSTAFYSNPQLDALLDRAHGEGDSAARADLYRRADAIVCDEAPWAFTFGYHSFDVRQPYVRGFSPHPVWGRDVTNVWLDRGGSGRGT
jgi:ABC-type transport system substrate-binding protein